LSTAYKNEKSNMRPLKEGKVKEKYESYIGLSYNYLTILSIVGVTTHSKVIAQLVCECGNIVQRGIRTVLVGNCISCGCKNKKREIRTKVGDVFSNCHGEVVEVIAVRSALDIDVRFVDCGTVASFHQGALKNGSFKNRNRPSVYGIGFIGFGKYSSGGKYIKTYKHWQSMLQRCYDEAFIQKHPTYKGCTVVDLWHNFQNFAAWFENKVNSIEGYDDFQIDKDLLEKGNKVYSPEKCCVLPREINLLIVNSSAARGNLPLGVIWHKKKQEYRAQMTMTLDGNRRNVHIKTSDDPLECFAAYKNYKENHIKFMAEKYKNCLTEEAYSALINWKIELTD